VTYTYVYFSGGKHQRHPRTTGSGFVVIDSYPSGSSTPMYQPSKLPGTDTNGPKL
jgi:hypothetical protein